MRHLQLAGVQCDRRRRDDDHLSLVAGISRLQREELSSRDVTTLESLGELVSGTVQQRASRKLIENP